jgi:uncharacterized protein (TIGR02246 family)
MVVGQEREVLAPIRAYFDALNGRDLDAVMGVFTADAVVVPNDAASAVGGEAVRATYADRFETFDYRRELHVDDWIVDGDLATVRCHTTGSFTLRAEGRRIDGVSRELFVLQRQSGDWRIRWYMFNRDASL